VAAEWHLAAALLVLSAMGTGLLLVFPMLVEWFVDGIIPERRVGLAWQAGGVAVLAFTLKELLAAGRMICGSLLEQRLTAELRSEFHERLLKLPIPWFDRQRTGDLVTRLADDIPAIRRIVIEGLEQGVTAILQATAAAVVMLATHSQLAWITLIPVPFIAAGGWMYARWISPRALAARTAAGSLSATFLENMAGVRQLKANRAEAFRTEAFERKNESARRAQMGVARLWAVYAPGLTFLGHLGLAMLLTLGAVACIEDAMTTGELMKFVLLVGFLYEPISRLHGVNQTLQDGLAAAGRVFELLDESPEPESLRNAEGPERLSVEQGIDFEGVTFCYPGSEQAALRDVSLTAKRGELTAIVGASGAGKSTLFHLLVRFHSTDHGRIGIDGQSIAETDLATLRDSIAYVAQEPFLFSGSVRENLRLAKPEAEDAALWEALEKVGAADLVRSWETGLDTELGERGVRLSGGEKQRLALARAFLTEAPILLLDEATSALDSISERSLGDALARFRNDRVCLAIAHRLSTVLEADMIHVMRDGGIIASGTHAELLKTCPYYASLAELALARDA
jgi:ATP-binding cassette subfamily B protein/subfamily B ATP-binding cassette protein MsbA